MGASHPGLELVNLEGINWLFHGDLALESAAEFLSVCEHRLIPPRARFQLARVPSVWAPAYQEAYFVGAAGRERHCPLPLLSFLSFVFFFQKKSYSLCRSCGRW